MYEYIISGFSDEIHPDIPKQFEHLNNLGVSFFEPRGINGINISDLSDEQLEQLKTDMKAYGIRVSSIGSPIGKIKITDDFGEHFEKFKRTVYIAKSLDCKYIRMFSFFIPDGEKPEKYRDEVFIRMKAFIDYAIANDVVLLHENEKDIYGDTDDRCLDLMKELYCDNFKAVFDPANFVQCGVDTKTAWDKLCTYVEYMHIKDADKDGNVVPAGKGIGNVEYVINQYLKMDNSHVFSLEPHLGSFEGLQALELDDEMLKLEKSDASKFTIAYNSFKTILKGIE